MDYTVQPRIEVNAQRVNAAIDLALKTSSRGMETIVKSTAYHTARKATEYTPFVTQGRIDSDMDAITTAIVHTAGVRKGSTNITFDGDPDASTENWPEAYRIILARMQPNSAYNRRTDSRWALEKPSTQGRMAFRFWVEQAAERMVRARHSSTHFLRSGWAAVCKKIGAMGFGRIMGDQRVSGPDVKNQSFGDVIYRASENAVILRIENKIGSEGTPNLSIERERALFEHSGPALERALAEQTMEMKMNYIPKVEKELKAEWEAV